MSASNLFPMTDALSRILLHLGSNDSNIFMITLSTSSKFGSDSKSTVLVNIYPSVVYFNFSSEIHDSKTLKTHKVGLTYRLLILILVVHYTH